MNAPPRRRTRPTRECALVDRRRVRKRAMRRHTKGRGWPAGDRVFRWPIRGDRKPGQCVAFHIGGSLPAFYCMAVAFRVNVWTASSGPAIAGHGYTSWKTMPKREEGSSRWRISGRRRGTPSGCPRLACTRVQSGNCILDGRELLLYDQVVGGAWRACERSHRTRLYDERVRLQKLPSKTLQELSQIGPKGLTEM